MYQNSIKVYHTLAFIMVISISYVFSNIVDHEAINKSNASITICFRANDALETNDVSLEVKSVDGQRFYGFLTKIGWTSETGKVSFHCGGALISNKFVLSVAHCMEYERPMYKSQPDIVRIAERPLEGHIVGEDIQIASIYTHPLYGVLSMYDDIAVIELRALSKYRPACIWTGVALPTTNIFALGHDLPNHGTQQIMSLKFVNTDECDRIYSPSRKLPDGIINSQFCAGKSNITEGNKCKGYIGAPVLTQTADSSSEDVFIVGLTNYGQRCSSSDFPNIYTKLSFYKDWIKEVVNGK